jgi:hypothetical protein
VPKAVITWDNLSADLVLSYVLRTMELDGEVMTYTNVQERYLELKPTHGEDTFGVAVDILEDQGFLEDKIAKVADPKHPDGVYGHLYYVYEPAEGWADALVAKVEALRGTKRIPVQPQRPATATGCGKGLGKSAKTCGYDDYQCSGCLKDKK